MDIFTRSEIAPEVDRQKVNEILAGLVLPPEIVKVDAEFGPDNTGDPSVKVRFHLPPDFVPSNDDMERLRRFLSDVRDRLWQADIGGYPYPRLAQAS